MSEKDQSRTSEPPRPVDVNDGIPDRAERPKRRLAILLGAVFLGWLGFLIYCAAAGNP